MEEMIVNAIMDQLVESDRNLYGIKTNINHFGQIFELEDEEGNKHREKTKIPIIILSENEEGRKTKEIKTRVMKKMETTGKGKKRQRCTTLIVTMN